MRKATIYTRGLAGYVRHEVKLIEHGRRQWAQFNDAPFVTFRPKRARKNRTIIQGAKVNRSMLILEGWGHIEPPEKWNHHTRGDIAVSQAVYSLADPQLDTDFDETISRYLKNQGVEVIADYRDCLEQGAG